MLTIILVLQKHSQSERIVIESCNCSVILLFIEWMAATRIASKLNTFEKRTDCMCLFQRNTVPLEILGHWERPSEIMMVTHKCIAVNGPLK